MTVNLTKSTIRKGKNVLITSYICDRSKGRADSCNDTHSFKVKDDCGHSGYQESWEAINVGYIDSAAVEVFRLYGRIQIV